MVSLSNMHVNEARACIDAFTITIYRDNIIIEIARMTHVPYHKYFVLDWHRWLTHIDKRHSWRWMMVMDIRKTSWPSQGLLTKFLINLFSYQVFSSFLWWISKSTWCTIKFKGRFINGKWYWKVILLYRFHISMPLYGRNSHKTRTHISSSYISQQWQQ